MIHCTMSRCLLLLTCLTCINADQQYLSVRIGMTVNMSCPWTPNSTTFTWHGPPNTTPYYKSGVKNNELKHRISVFKDEAKRMFILQITQIANSDLGLYVCAVTRTSEKFQQSFRLQLQDSTNETGTTQLIDIAPKPLQCVLHGQKETVHTLTLKHESNSKIAVTIKTDDNEKELRLECGVLSTKGFVKSQENAMAPVFGLLNWLIKTHNNNAVTCFLQNMENVSDKRSVKPGLIKELIHNSSSFVDFKEMVCSRSDNKLDESYENCSHIQGLVMFQKNQCAYFELNFIEVKYFNIRYSEPVPCEIWKQYEISSGPYFLVYFLPVDNQIECLTKKNRNTGLGLERDLVGSVVGGITTIVLLLTAGMNIFFCYRKVIIRRKNKKRETMTPLSSDQVSSVVQNSLYSTVANEQAQRVQREPLNEIEESEFEHTDSSRDEDQRRLNYIEVHFDNSVEIPHFSGTERRTEYMEIDFSRTIPNGEHSRDGQQNLDTDTE